MNTFRFNLPAALLVASSLLLGPALRAQSTEAPQPAEAAKPAPAPAAEAGTATEAPPAAEMPPATETTTAVEAPPAPEPASAPAPEPVAAPEPAAAPEATVAPEAAEESAPADVEPAAESTDLRRLDEPAAAPEDATEADASSARGHRRRHHSNQLPFGDHVIAEGSTVYEAVSVLGSTTVNGVVEGPAVAVFGDARVNGSTGGETIAVLGNIHIDGTVGGEVVAVLGNVDLGPKAEVKGDMVIIGGKLTRDPAATFKGDLQEIPIPMWSGDVALGLKTWFKRCVLLGRPLAFGEHLGWAWTIAVAVFALYVLLALLFPRGFEKCAQTLEQRPGSSLLAVLLTVLIIPVLVVLLIITGVGILLLPFLIVGLIIGSIFGKAVMHAWLGRRITRYFGPGPLQHVAVATLLGGVILLLLYTVPFLGFFLFKVLSIIGLGVVVYTMIQSTRREKPVVAPAAAGVAAVAGAAAGEPTLAPPPLAAVAAAALPRAGFWIRIAASVIDAVLVGIVTAVTHTGEALPAIFAVYCVVMWAMKGTTIGGIICGLKVVRLDDRKVDWLVAVVRGLAGFLSLAVAGLGFLWAAFDDQKQSWHDKIAGTTIVRVPRGIALL